jgi:hypothetical protein
VSKAVVQVTLPSEAASGPLENRSRELTSAARAARYSALKRPLKSGLAVVASHNWPYCTSPV